MYTMKETCEMVNMTYETVKYYCNVGLIPNVKRDKNNHRVFDENNINWIKSLSCLKNCGMSIEEMKEYLTLCLKGPSTIPKRKEILSIKRKELLEKQKKLQDSIDYIDWKQGFYDDVLTGKINLNTATMEELQTLSGIGESKAQAIIDYREENGQFSKPEDILEVSGIGETLYEKIKDNITV